MRQEIKDRMPLWDAAGLALTDQLMASAGPAMEVVGRYSEVLDKAGNPVALDRYLPLARQMVQEAANIRIDDLPLGTFDERTRFALFWAKVFGRSITPGSEARWQRLAADLDDDGNRVGIRRQSTVRASASPMRPSPPSHRRISSRPTRRYSTLRWRWSAMARALPRSAEVLIAADRIDDPYVWAAVQALSDSVPEARSGRRGVDIPGTEPPSRRIEHANVAAAKTAGSRRVPRRLSAQADPEPGGCVR